MATIEELEDKIRKLEEKMSMQDLLIQRILDFVQHAIGDQFEKRITHYKQKKEDEERRRKEVDERTEKIKEKMRKLGYSDR